MKSDSGALSFEVLMETSSAEARLAAMERRIRGFADNAVRDTSRIDSALQNLGKLAVGAFALNGLSELPQQLLRVRGEVEQLEIAFSVLLKSKSKADALLAQTTEFAAKTPFSFKETADGAKQLLAYGLAAKDIIPTLSRLGDISAGLGLPLERLTYLYGTTKTQGRLFAQDLNQFVGSGIPLISELAKQFGVAEDKVRGLVENGKVGFAEVKKAIEGMTSGSGLFTGTLAAQSKSINALKEQLASAYDAVLNQIGKDNQDLISGVILSTTEAVKNYQSFAEAIGVVVATYGTYRAAILLVATAQKAQLIFTQTMAVQQGLAALSGQVLSASQVRLAATTSLLSRAQAGLNATMLANPYVLVATALAALVSYAVIYTDETQKLKTSQELLAESSKEVQRNFRQQSGEVNVLIGVIKNQNVAESERIKAYERLKQIAPDVVAGLDFQRAKTADLTEAVNTYLVALRKKIQLEVGQGKVKEAYDQQAEAAEKLKKAEDNLVANRGKNNRTVVGVGDVNGPTLGRSAAQQAQADYEEAIKYKQKADDVVTQVETRLSSIYSGTSSKTELEANIARQQRVLSSIPDKLSVAYKNAETSLNDYQAQLAKLNASETQAQAVKGKTIEQLNEEIKLKKDSLNTGNTDAQNASINKEIDRLEAQKRKLTGELSTAEKKSIREAAKSGPFGSIDYYEQVSKKAGEILEKLGPNDTAKIAKQSQIKFDADQKVEDLRKQYAIKSFDEELADKRSKYELYQKWIDTYGQTSATNQFDALLKNGKTYVDYLNTEIARLETQKTNGTLNEKDSKNLGSLLTQRDEATGKKTAIQTFNEELQKAQQEAGSLSGYLAILKQKQDALGESTNTPTDLAIRKELAEESIKTQQQLKLQLDQYLTDFAGSEQQQLAIRTKYNELRAELDKKYANNRGTEYKNALTNINNDEEKSIEDFQRRQLEQTDAYKATTKVILEQGEKRAAIEIANQRKVVDEAKKSSGVASEVYKEQVEKLDALIKKNGGTPAQKILGNYATVFSAFGQSLSALGGEAGKAGDMLSDLANSLALAGQAMEKGIKPSQLYAYAIQGLVGLFSAITDAAAKRKQVENDYYASVIAQQQQYNLLLNEQLAIRSKNKNPFIEDYTSELQDNFDAQEKAQAKLDESLKKLNEGKAKEGLKNQIDNNTALGLISKGVGTGAVIGALIGGPAAPVTAAIGAVIGGAVGALTSLFGGATKKADEFGALLERYPDLIQQSADGTKRINTALAQTLIDTGQLDDKTKALVQTTLEWQKQVDATKQAIQDIVKGLVGELGDKLRDSLVGAFKDGTDAAQAFSGVLNDVIEDFVTKLLYSKIFTPFFNKLSDEITKSLDTNHGGDGNIIDDLQRFQEYSKVGQQAFDRSLQQLKDYSKSLGYDILKPTNSNSIKNPNSQAQLIQASVTETTANLLVGQANAQRILTADSNALIRQQLLALSGIEANTARIQRTNELLDEVSRGIKRLNDNSTRGIGQPL